MLFKNLKRRNTCCYKYDSIDSNQLPFWIADSDYASPKVVTKALIKRSKHGAYGYSCPGKTYNKVVKEYIKRQYNYDVSENNIQMTNGIVGALFYAIKMLDSYSDSIVIQTPVYHQFYEVIKKSGKKLVENKLLNDNGYFKINFLELEQIFRKTKIMILCNPHNPVGRSYSYEELEKLVLLAKKHNVFILADEIHCDLMLYQNKFYSLNLFSELYKNIMVFFAPSKAFNVAGLKISNVVSLNDSLMASYKEVLDNYYYPSPNLFALTAIKAAYTKGDDWLVKQSAFLTSNYEDLKTYFEKKHPNVVVTQMEATFLAWLDLSYLNKECEEIYEGLQKVGILISPGKKYGGDCDGFIRFNFACDKKMLNKGLQRITKYLKITERENLKNENR